VRHRRECANTAGTLHGHPRIIEEPFHARIDSHSGGRRSARRAWRLQQDRQHNDAAAHDDPDVVAVELIDFAAGRNERHGLVDIVE